MGIYELADFSINVSRKADALFITATGDATLPIFSKTETEFFLEAADATISFTKDEAGAVRSSEGYVTWYQWRTIIRCKKISLPIIDFYTLVNKALSTRI